MVVLVQGPPGVGKTAVIQALIRHYTRHAIPNPKGPITLVAGKQRRITLLECPQVGGPCGRGLALSRSCTLQCNPSCGASRGTCWKEHARPVLNWTQPHYQGPS